MSLSSRIALSSPGAASRDGETPARRLYTCHYCHLADEDSEVVFQHIRVRACRFPDIEGPVSPFVRAALRRKLPAKRFW